MDALLKKKVWAIASTVDPVLIGWTVAAAYWTCTKSGNIQASVGTASSFTLSGSITSEAVADGFQPVSFMASSPGPSDVLVDPIHLVGLTVDTARPACVTGDFSMADVSANQSVPKGSVNFPIAATGSLLCANTTSIQKARQGATLTLAFSSN